MEKTKVKVLVNNTIMMYLLSIAKLIIPLISLPYLTRVLSVDCYGSVSFAKNLVSYMQVLIDFGFLLSGTKDIIKAIKNKQSTECVIGDIFYAQALLSLIATLIMLICSFSFDVLDGYELFAMLSIVPAVLSIFLFEYVFKAHEQMGKIAIKFVIMKVLAFILTIAFVKNDSDIYLIPLFDIIGCITVIIMTFIQLHKENISININLRRIVNALAALKDSFVYFISNFATTAFTLLNTLIIGIMLTKSDIAYWNITMQLVTAIQALYAPIINSVFPTMVKEKNLNLIHKIMLIYMPLIFAGCGLILLVGDWGVSLVFTQQYLKSSQLLKYLIPVLIFSFPGMLYGWPCLGAIDKQRQATATTIFGAVVQVLGLILLAVFDVFNLISICIVRNITEIALCLIRIIFVYSNKKLFTHQAIKINLSNTENNMEEKNSNLLKDIQDIQLDILIKFDELCKKLNLKYSICAGTLLGAVRHKGFIPWDDDIDVAMVREDYEILVKEANKHLPEGYFLQHYTTDKYATNFFVKIRNINTTWVCHSDIKNPKHCLGFGVDVFPIDRIIDEKHRKKTSRKARLYDILRYDYIFNPQRHTSLFKKIRTVFTSLIAKLIGRYHLNKLHDKAVKNSKLGEFTGADSIYNNIVMPYNIFEKYSAIEFEGREFSCIQDYETYLKATYGDYMQLPPIEDRKPKHEAKIIDIKKSYVEYLKPKK